MTAIRATWTKGQIVPLEPVDWPEGSELLVEPVAAGMELGMREEDWKDDPESIAAWIAAVGKIEPMVWEAGEREAYERFREQFREFNLEAVRKRMADMDQDDAP